MAWGMQHWLALFVVLAVGYWIGTKYPNIIGGLRIKAGV